MQWNDSFNESVFSFCNNIYTPEGGTHLAGFRNALTRVVNDYGRKGGHAQSPAIRTFPATMCARVWRPSCP